MLCSNVKIGNLEIFTILEPQDDQGDQRVPIRGDLSTLGRKLNRIKGPAQDVR